MTLHILYGIQGTGNGHLSRARAMAKAFDSSPVTVDYLLSGRSSCAHFDMDEFTSMRFCKGVTFATKSGRVCRRQTLKELSPLRLIRDIVQTYPQRYDLVMTDFEPITAWSSRLKRCAVIGLGHQYALRGVVPLPSGDPIGHLLLRAMAPTDLQIGFHWHRFQPDTLPPIIDSSLRRRPSPRPFTLVYLPFFGDMDELLKVLMPVPDRIFVVYSPSSRRPRVEAGITLLPLSRAAALGSSVHRID